MYFFLRRYAKYIKERREKNTARAITRLEIFDKEFR